MKKVYTLSLLLMLLPAWIYAHLGNIRGQITEASTGLTLPGVHVFLAPEMGETFTNELGVFSFTGIEAGLVRLRFSFLGFADQEVVAEIQAGQTTTLQIALTPAPIELPLVRLQAEASDNLQAVASLELQLRPMQSAQDMLRAVPGLFIAQHAGGGKAEQIFLRGFDIDHGTDIAIDVDGMPVNMVSHAHGQGYADLHFLIPEMIERVSFQKGPYQAETGNLATAGSVSFQTKRALDRNFVKLEAGQFDTYRAVAGINLLPQNQEVSKRNAYLAAEGLYSNGFFESPQNFSRINLMGRFQTFLSQHQNLSLTASYFTSRWDASGQIPMRAVADGTINRFGAIDETEGGQTSRTNLQAAHQAQLGKVFWENRLFLIHYDFELYSNFTFFLENPVDGDQIRQREDRWIAGYHSRIGLDISLGDRVWQWESGLQARLDRTDDSELSWTKMRETTLDRLVFGDIREANMAAYSRFGGQLSDRLGAAVGLRYDFFNFHYTDQLVQDTAFTGSTGQLSPKLSLDYRAGSNIQFYLQAGYGFHSNDARTLADPSALVREMVPGALGADLGLVWKPFPSLLFQAAFWQLFLEQEFVYVGDAGIVEPGGRTFRTGLDLSANFQIIPRLFLDGEVNLARPRSLDAEEGAEFIPLAPVLTSSGGLTWRGQALTGGFRYRMLADRSANEDYSLTASGFFLLDLVGAYRLKNLEFGVSVQNVLNTDWEEAQFETTSRLTDETEPVTEIHFTPGSPFFAKGWVMFNF